MDLAPNEWPSKGQTIGPWDARPAALVPATPVLWGRDFSLETAPREHITHCACNNTQHRPAHQPPSALAHTSPTPHPHMQCEVERTSAKFNRGSPHGADGALALVRRFLTLRSEMSHFCTNLQYYIMYEVMETAWQDFNAEVCGRGQC
eukprot:361513-Chlamydomonas_euryale.AAC.3